MTVRVRPVPNVVYTGLYNDNNYWRFSHKNLGCNAPKRPITLCHRTTKFHVLYEEGHVSCGQPRLPSEDSGVPGLPKFGILLHPLTQKDQIRHGNVITWGGAF